MHFLVKRPSSHKEASAPLPRALESEVLQQKDLWCIPDLHSLCVSHYLPLDTVTGFHSKGTQGRSLCLPEQGDFFSANGMERDESLTSHVVRPPPLPPFWQRSTSLPHYPPALLLASPPPPPFPSNISHPPQQGQVFLEQKSYYLTTLLQHLQQFFVTYMGSRAQHFAMGQ